MGFIHRSHAFSFSFSLVLPLHFVNHPQRDITMTAALPSTTGGETSVIVNGAALDSMNRLSEIVGKPSTTSSELSPLTTQLQASIVEQKVMASRSK